MCTLARAVVLSLVVAVQQPVTTASEYVARWKNRGSDITALTALESSAQVGSEFLRAMLRVAVDPSFPRISRIQALWATTAYAAPSLYCNRDTIEARPTTAGIFTLEKSMCMLGSHASYSRSSAVESAWRDSALAVYHDLSLREDGALLRVASALYRGSSWGRLDRFHPEQRTECVTASGAYASALAAKPNGSVSTLELQIVPQCTEHGPDMLAKGWEAVSDSADMLWLKIMSAQLSDTRIFNALLRVAVNRDKPQSVRIAAIGAAGTQLHPKLYSYSHPARHAGAPATCSAGWMYSDDAVPISGSSPLTGKARQDGVTSIEVLSRSIEAGPVREAAEFVASCAAHLLKTASLR